MAQQCDEWWNVHRDTWVATEKARLAAEVVQMAVAATTAPDDLGSRNSILMALAARAPAMSRSSSGAAATGSDAPPSAHAIVEIADSDADASATVDSIPVSPAKRSAPRAFPEVVIPKVRVKKEKDAEPEKPRVKGKKPEFDGPVRTLLPALFPSAANFLIGSRS
jgi:hypothetical protein